RTPTPRTRDALSADEVNRPRRRRRRRARSRCSRAESSRRRRSHRACPDADRRRGRAPRRCRCRRGATDARRRRSPRSSTARQAAARSCRDRGPWRMAGKRRTFAAASRRSGPRRRRSLTPTVVRLRLRDGPPSPTMRASPRRIERLVKTVFVIDRIQDWPFELPGSSVVTARSYLADAAGGASGDAQVINLCRADRYQGRGYYVSLLAEARGHRPLPDVKTVEDLKSDEQIQRVGEAIDELANETLHHDESDRFELDAYFGRDPGERHQPLAEQLFANVRAPLLRTRFRRESGRWTLEKIAAIGVADVPAQHRALLLDAAKAFVTGSEPTREARR